MEEVLNNTEKLKTRQAVWTHTVSVKFIFGRRVVSVDDENYLKTLSSICLHVQLTTA